ncbi:MAG: di-heme enzyme [bacterium]
MRYSLILLFLLAACGQDESPSEPDPTEWSWDIPQGFPTPRVPEDNPMSVAKVELGRRLFYDVRLSGNETQSCGSCHDQSLAFTDGKAVSEGATGEFTSRGAMALGNVVYASVLTWGNPLMRTLEKQQLTPLFADTPVELGLTSNTQVLDRLLADELYPELFANAFPDEPEPVSIDTMTKAISAFQRSILSTDTPYDRVVYKGQPDAMSAAAKRGKDLFFSERLECFHCHGEFNFSDSVEHNGTVFDEVKFHNNGLYNIGGSGAYPTGNQGIFEISGVLEDSGRFKAPSLRNIAVTAPYMHDGSIQTLEEVIDHYARGGRLIEEGPNAGDGKFNPFKSELITGFVITEAEKADLIEFLKALTDETMLTNPAYSDPFSTNP